MTRQPTYTWSPKASLNTGPPTGGAAPPGDEIVVSDLEGAELVAAGLAEHVKRRPRAPKAAS